MPGVFMSIRRNVIPICRFGALGSVRTRQKHQSAMCAVEVQIFWPLTTYSSPSRRAAVFSAARSEPAPGSEKPWHHQSSTSARPRQEPLLLFLGAELDQYRPDHRDVEHLHVGRRRQLVLLEEHHALDRRPARPAMFPGPAVGGPALLVEDALPADRVVLLRRPAEPHLLADVRGQIVGDEAAHLVAERQLFLAEAQVHDACLPGASVSLLRFL